MQWIIAILGILVASSAFASDFVFISVAGEKRIATYQMNSSDGQLTKVSDVTTAGEPGARDIRGGEGRDESTCHC